MEIIANKLKKTNWANSSQYLIKKLKKVKHQFYLVYASRLSHLQANQHIVTAVHAELYPCVIVFGSNTCSPSPPSLKSNCWHHLIHQSPLLGQVFKICYCISPGPITGEPHPWVVHHIQLCVPVSSWPDLLMSFAKLC